jgi:hypothetical protein
MKLLTFLGKSDYKETTYCWREMEHHTKFAPIASCHFLQPDQLVVFLTNQARDAVFDEFAKSIPADVRVLPVEVPLGKTESELWTIFEQIRESVRDEVEIAFDITHGMRSSPLLSMLVAAFLKSGFNIQIKAVLYGAFEAKQDNKTPMFDLTPLLTLLEWSSAADRFNRTGDSRYLASLLRAYQKELATRPDVSKDDLFQLTPLNGLAGNLTGLSQSLQLIRPSAVMQFADKLIEKTKQAREALQIGDSARPFQALLDSILQTYQPLAYPDPDQPSSVEMAKEVLTVERRLIRWYYEREWWVQAASLAREWVISWLMVQTGNTNIRTQSVRETYERLLGAESDAFVEAKKSGKNYQTIFLASVPQIDEVLSFWPPLTVVRNDILHAGQREKAEGAESLISQLGNLIAKLENLPL